MAQDTTAFFTESLKVRSQIGSPDETARDIIGRELKKLAHANGGAITPEGIVEEARSEASPLHRFFEWDDGVAAVQWRLDQARRMIMSAKFIVQAVEERGRQLRDQTGIVREWIPDGKRSRVFRSRAEVMSEEAQRTAWIEERIAALRAWSNSVIDVKELAAVRISVDKSLARFDSK